MCKTARLVTDVTVLAQSDRLAALRRLLLLDTAPSTAFDRLTRLTSRLLDAPIALVTLVDADRQWFKSTHGAMLPSGLRETPLTHSLCALVVLDEAPLVVADTHDDPRLRDHPAVTEAGVRAYAGAPLYSPDGYAVGTLCAIDLAPHRWSDTDVETLRELADVAMREMALHVHERRDAHRRAWQGVSRSTALHR
jgi:GAF domain-containing protein